MRIARILTRLNLGGPARQALASDPILGARGHTVRIFAGIPEAGEGDLFDEFRARGLDVVRMPLLRRSPAPLADLRARRALRRALGDFGPDLVHTHASKAGLVGRRAAAGWPRVHTFHGHVLEGYFSPFLSRRLQALERRLARTTDRILAVSHRTAEDLLRLGVTRPEKLVVVPPGIELGDLLTLGEAGGPGEVRRAIGVGEEAVVVGVVGRLAEVKQPWRAVAIFAMLCERFPRLHLVFVGDGTARGRLEREIAALGPGGRDRLHLLGPRPHMPAVLADLDVVLLTSRSEGMPVALIEAGAAGRPVVATDVGGVSEVVVHGRTGFLGTTDRDLADGLATLVADPAARRAMGGRARLRVTERHGAPALADRLEAVYRAVVEGGGES